MVPAERVKKVHYYASSSSCKHYIHLGDRTRRFDGRGGAGVSTVLRPLGVSLAVCAAEPGQRVGARSIVRLHGQLAEALAGIDLLPRGPAAVN